MGQLKLKAIKSARTNAQHPDTNYSAETIATNLHAGFLYLGFEAFPSSMLNKKITGVDFYQYVIPWKEPVYGLGGVISDYLAHPTGVFGRTLYGEWDEKALTYANAGSLASVVKEITTGTTYSDNQGRYVQSLSNLTYLPDIRRVLDYGLAVETYDRAGSSSAKANAQLPTSRYSGLEPYIVVTYDDTPVTLTVESVSPSAGYVPKFKPTTFQWQHGTSGIAYGEITLAKAVFRWRPGTEGDYTEIDCGTDLSYTIPANTFTTDTVQWQVELTDNYGTATTSDWYTLSTKEALSAPQTISPKSTMIDGAKPQTFTWAHVISTGTQATKSVIAVSSNSGKTWTSVPVSGSQRYYVFPANYFTAGDWVWRVQTYNTDGNAGSWSDWTAFTVVANPQKPAVSAEQTPRPLISWQSSGQQSFQVRVDDVFDSGTIYGLGTSYKLPVYLPDGSYTVYVRIQNQYGLLSDWGSAPLEIQNAAGPVIVLNAWADAVATLQWEKNDAYSAYLVERDGEPIGKTESIEYIDRFSVGSHRYRVRGLMAGTDNYGLSNEESVTVSVNSPVIIDAETGEITELKYSTSQYTEIRVEESVVGTVRHFTDAVYPSAEMSKFRDKSVSVSVAFRRGGEDKAFKALIGRLVCLKTQEDEMVIGVLQTRSKTISKFYVQYTCTVQNTDFREDISL